MRAVSIKTRLCRALWAAGGASACRVLFNARHPHAVRILSGHRVMDGKGVPSGQDQRDLERGCLSLSEFRERIGHLRARYRFLSLADYAAQLEKGLRPPANAVVLTFDDGFCDVYDHVFPALAPLRIPFAVFLTTGWLGRQGIMSGEQVREMAGRGGGLISWGAHGVTHRPLTDMDLGEAENEIVRSREETEHLVGSPVRLFCYPDGKFNADIRRLMAGRDFLAACATGRRINVGKADRYALQRIPFESEAFDRFAFRVAGWV